MVKTKRSEIGENVLNSFKKIVGLICLGCLAFYTGAKLVENTEAKFTDNENKQITISTAFVFPNTIDKLVEEAERLSVNLLDSYTNIQDTPKNLTIKEVETALEDVEKKREDLLRKIKELTTILTEAEAYYEKTKTESINPNWYDFVETGYLKIKEDYDRCTQVVKLEKVDEKIISLKKKREELQHEELQHEEQQLEDLKEENEQNHLKESSSSLNDSKENERGVNQKEPMTQEEPKQGERKESAKEDSTLKKDIDLEEDLNAKTKRGAVDEENSSDLE